MTYRIAVFAVAGLLLMSVLGLSQPLEVGDLVWAQWEPNDWYPGVLAEATDLGFMVAFDDTTGVAYVNSDLPANADMPPSLLILIREATADEVTIGTRVLAEWEDQWMYPATVASEAKDGLYDIVFDDRAVGTVALSQLLLRSESESQDEDLSVGDVVWAQWEPNDWYSAKIIEASAIGFRIVFYDSDGTPFGDPEEAAWADRPRSLLVPDRVPAADDIAFGARVLAQWSDDWFYPATVMSVADGLYEVLYDDRDVRVVELAELRLFSE